MANHPRLLLQADKPLGREFVTMEQWTDHAAATAHMAKPHVANAIGRAGRLLAQPPQIHRFMQRA
jgi:quinol monooxygenase YgiN